MSMGIQDLCTVVTPSYVIVARYVLRASLFAYVEKVYPRP